MKTRHNNRFQPTSLRPGLRPFGWTVAESGRNNASTPLPRRAFRKEKVDMARCTALLRGHRSAAAAEACLACAGRYGCNRGFSSYSSHEAFSSPSSLSSGGSAGRSSGVARPRRSRAGSSVSCTLTQVQSLTPVRNAVEVKAAEQPHLRDVF